MYQNGEEIEIVGGEYAGLGGTIVAISESGYEVLLGYIYRVLVQEADLAPLLPAVAHEALAELRRLGGNARVILRLEAALRFYE